MIVTKLSFGGIIRNLKQIKDVEVLEVEHLSNKKIRNGTDVEEIAYYYTEVTNKGVNKWTAIEFLINELGISKEEVMTIGDNTNDQEMIINAGLGVVMRNSAPHVKAIGDVVVSTNDDDGVAEAIEKFVINGN